MKGREREISSQRSLVRTDNFGITRRFDSLYQKPTRNSIELPSEHPTARRVFRWGAISGLVLTVATLAAYANGHQRQTAEPSIKPIDITDTYIIQGRNSTVEEDLLNSGGMVNVRSEPAFDGTLVGWLQSGAILRNLSFFDANGHKVPDISYASWAEFACAQQQFGMIRPDFNASLPKQCDIDRDYIVSISSSPSQTPSAR